MAPSPLNHAKTDPVAEAFSVTSGRAVPGLGPHGCLRAGAGLDVDIRGVERLAAVGAAQLGLRHLVAASMAAEDGRPGVARGPAVAPGGDDGGHHALSRDSSFGSIISQACRPKPAVPV